LVIPIVCFIDHSCRLARRRRASARQAAPSYLVEKCCCRCGLLETDFHLFFLCPFAKAAWFLSPWFLRPEVFTQNVDSFSSVLLSLLSLDHPEANLNSIATFLWCLWKARNDELFGRKKTKRKQIAMHAKALMLDLEVSSLTPTITAAMHAKAWRNGLYLF
jgi:hypothetical protein